MNNENIVLQIIFFCCGEDYNVNKKRGYTSALRFHDQHKYNQYKISTYIETILVKVFKCLNPLKSSCQLFQIIYNS